MSIILLKPDVYKKTSQSETKESLISKLTKRDYNKASYTTKKGKIINNILESVDKEGNVDNVYTFRYGRRTLTQAVYTGDMEDETAKNEWVKLVHKEIQNDSNTINKAWNIYQETSEQNRVNAGGTQLQVIG